MSFLTQSCLVYILYHPGSTEIEALNEPLCSVHCSRQPVKRWFDPEPLFGCHSSKSKKKKKSIYITESFTCWKITGELDHMVKWLMERKCCMWSIFLHVLISYWLWKVWWSQDFCLCLAISAFAVAALVLPGSYPYYLDLIHSLSIGPFLTGLAKFGIAFPVSYHTYNGIRHLVRFNNSFFKLPNDLTKELLTFFFLTLESVWNSLVVFLFACFMRCLDCLA